MVQYIVLPRRLSSMIIHKKLDILHSYLKIILGKICILQLDRQRDMLVCVIMDYGAGWFMPVESLLKIKLHIRSWTDLSGKSLNYRQVMRISTRPALQQASSPFNTAMISSSGSEIAAVSMVDDKRHHAEYFYRARYRRHCSGRPLPARQTRTGIYLRQFDIRDGCGIHCGGRRVRRLFKPILTFLFQSAGWYSSGQI